MEIDSDVISISEPQVLYVLPDRPMAIVVRVIKLAEIADTQLAVAHVLGWQCVVRKGEFSKDGLAIYCALDSVFPKDYHRTAFLKGEPIKTRKLQKHLSQGLLLPIEILQEDFGVDIDTCTIGQDVTSVLRVRKFISKRESMMYVVADSSSKKSFSRKDPLLRPFPSIVPKTDEERIQFIPEILDTILDCEVVVTRKEDGCSATYIFDNDALTICSRNNIQPSGVFLEIAQRYNLEEKMRAIGRQVAVQGEIVGPKVNGNRLKLSTLTYRVFNVYDIQDGVFLDHDAVASLCEMLEVEMVPLLYRGVASAAPMMSSLENLLDYTSSLEYGPGLPAEGVVVKVNELTPTRRSFKVISNTFLIKYKE